MILFELYFLIEIILLNYYLFDNFESDYVIISYDNEDKKNKNIKIKFSIETDFN